MPLNPAIPQHHLPFLRANSDTIESESHDLQNSSQVLSSPRIPSIPSPENSAVIEDETENRHPERQNYSKSRTEHTEEVLKAFSKISLLDRDSGGRKTVEVLLQRGVYMSYD